MSYQQVYISLLIAGDIFNPGLQGLKKNWKVRFGPYASFIPLRLFLTLQEKINCTKNATCSYFSILPRR